MAGKNQHFIPQFLQRGFASVGKTNEGFIPKGFDKKIKMSNKKEAQVWVFEKSNKPHLTKIRNNGAELFFYGSEDSIVDKAITKAEKKYAGLVNKLREHTSDTSLNEPLISELVVHLFIRTDHVRTSLKDLGGFGVEMVQQLLQDPLDFEMFILNSFQNDPSKFQEEINKKLSEFTPSQQKIIKQHIQNNPNLLATAIQNSIAKIYPTFTNSFEPLKNQLDHISKDSHIKSLSESIIPNARIEQFRSLNWFLSVQSLNSYILSDAVVLYSTFDEQYKPLLSENSKFKYILLPISSQHLLIGSTDSIIKNPDIEVVNQASASVSNLFFIASQYTQREYLYSQRIGNQCSVLSQEDLAHIEGNLRQEWIKAALN